MEANGSKSFSTGDLYLSAAISLFTSTYPDIKLENGRVFFNFPESDSIYQAIQDYNNGRLVDVYLFSEKIKRLRGEMISRKNIGRRGN